MNQLAPLQPGMLRTNLRNQIRQTALPKWKALLPLFEAVMNSFQAIQEYKGDRAHKITITVHRAIELFAEEEASIVGFEVRDTGVGFTDENFDSFNTAFSEHKFERGGKGLGRFMWLKAFDGVQISSVFAAEDLDRALRYGSEISSLVSTTTPILEAHSRSTKVPLVLLFGCQAIELLTERNVRSRWSSWPSGWPSTSSSSLCSLTVLM